MGSYQAEDTYIDSETKNALPSNAIIPVPTPVRQSQPTRAPGLAGLIPRRLDLSPANRPGREPLQLESSDGESPHEDDDDVESDAAYYGGPPQKITVEIPSITDTAAKKPRAGELKLGSQRYQVKNVPCLHTYFERNAESIATDHG